MRYALRYVDGGELATVECNESKMITAIKGESAAAENMREMWEDGELKDPYGVLTDMQELFRRMTKRGYVEVVSYE